MHEVSKKYRSIKMMEGEEDEMDILPDTDVDRERTLTGKWALFVLLIVVVFTTLAFTTPNWLEGDPRFYGTKMEKLGLWVHCFRSLPDYNDLRHQRFFAGCRWIFNPFTEGYPEIRNFLAPPFFVATQFFFTLSFINVLAAIILVVVYLLCINDDYRPNLLKIIGIDLMVAGFFASISILVFAAKADGPEFMPDYEHNYLSWSFGLAFVAAFFDFVDGILFLVESRIMKRKEVARQRQFPMEKRV